MKAVNISRESAGLDFIFIICRIGGVCGREDEKNKYETGWWGEELFALMQLLEKAGHLVNLASALGGKQVIDQRYISEDYEPNGRIAFSI